MNNMETVMQKSWCKSMIFCALGLSLVWNTTLFAAPAHLEPLPDVPPPPVGSTVEDEPEITIVKKNGQTVEEYRLNGELYMMKITPDHGVPYYLQRADEGGSWTRFDGPNAPLIVPKWVLFRF
jgi:hypothetical protein